MCKECWLRLKKKLNTGKFLVNLFFLSGLLPFAGQAADSHQLISMKIIEKYYQKTNGQIKHRFQGVKQLLLANQNLPVKKQLEATNNFYNQFIYQKDVTYQGTADYWKTPVKFIIDGRGDCEDFALAKYFTLRALGVPVNTLRITYVKSTELNQFHMVLAYYSRPQAEPIILDNLMKVILPASKREDLIPVYSFNGSNLWVAKHRGQDRVA